MDMMDLSFYILDAVILVMLIRMKKASDAIEIRTDVGARWVIPAMFWGIALIGVFRYTGIFRAVQTAVLVGFGGLYWTFNSGLSKDGIVMIGRLYPYTKLKKIQVDDADHCVNFSKNGAMAPIPFKEEQMRDVRNYLVKYAGIAKHDVRTRERKVK